MAKVLYSHGITDLVVVGLATDYCVRATAIDARKFGFPTTVGRDGISAIKESNEENVFKELEQWGAEVKILYPTNATHSPH